MNSLSGDSKVCSDGANMLHQAVCTYLYSRREVSFYWLLHEEKREFGNMPDVLLPFYFAPRNRKARDSIQLGYFREDTNEKSCMSWLVEGESLSGNPIVSGRR